MKSYTSVAFGSRVPGTFEVEHLEEKVKSELFFFISVPFCSQKSAKNEVAILLTTKELRGNWLLKLVDKRKLCAHFPTDTAPHFKETITIPTGFVDCCYKIRCDKSRVICNNFKLPKLYHPLLRVTSMLYYDANSTEIFSAHPICLWSLYTGPGTEHPASKFNKSCYTYVLQIIFSTFNVVYFILTCLDFWQDAVFNCIKDVFYLQGHFTEKFSLSS